MLNIEKYKEMLIDTGVININKPIECGECHCDECDCDFRGKKGCKSYLEEWLFSEYKEPEVDWSKVKVDTPILVRDDEGGKWIKRYFARFKYGEVYAWLSGATSWSAVGERCWNYVKLAESEEQ